MQMQQRAMKLKDRWQDDAVGLRFRIEETITEYKDSLDYNLRMLIHLYVTLELVNRGIVDSEINNKLHTDLLVEEHGIYKNIKDSYLDDIYAKIIDDIESIAEKSVNGANNEEV